MPQLAPSVQDDPNRLVDVEFVAEFLSVSRRTVWREVDRNPDFPQPIKFGQRAARQARKGGRSSRVGAGRVDARFARWRYADLLAFAKGAA